MKKKIGAGEFKAKCLQIMDEVMNTHIHVVITKHNVPIAALVPIEKEIKPSFGWMKGTIHIKGNIVAPINEDWDAAH
jgi:prevent-host-death family protein